jgi:hypothetical protein
MPIFILILMAYLYYFYKLYKSHKIYRKKSFISENGILINEYK